MIGAVLAGGVGHRLGATAGKASVPLAGRPLVAYPVAALSQACERVAVVCKPDSELPALAGVERWDEPAEPRHPIAGIAHALERAGEPVLVCAADMPLVTAEACRALLDAWGDAVAPAAVAAGADGALQPLLGVYGPAAVPPLRAAPVGSRLTEVVEALEPETVALPAIVLMNVNTPADLCVAERALAN